MTTACTTSSSLLTRSPVASSPWKISVWEKSAIGQSSTALSSSPPTTKWSRPARLTLRVKWWRESTPFIACRLPPKRRRMSGSSVSSELSFLLSLGTFLFSFILMPWVYRASRLQDFLRTESLESLSSLSACMCTEDAGVEQQHTCLRSLFKHFCSSSFSPQDQHHHYRLESFGCVLFDFLFMRYTLVEILIFCPKIQLWCPEKIVDFFLGEKLVKMLWFWIF